MAVLHCRQCWVLGAAWGRVQGRHRAPTVGDERGGRGDVSTASAAGIAPTPAAFAARQAVLLGAVCSPPACTAVPLGAIRSEPGLPGSWCWALRWSRTQGLHGAVRPRQSAVLSSADRAPPPPFSHWSRVGKANHIKLRVCSAPSALPACQDAEGRAVGAAGIPRSSSLGVVVWFFSLFFLIFFSFFFLPVGHRSFGTVLVLSAFREESRVASGVSPEYCQQISFRHLQKQNKTKQKKLPPFSVLLQEPIPGGGGEGGEGSTGMLLEEQTT